MHFELILKWAYRGRLARSMGLTAPQFVQLALQQLATAPSLIPTGMTVTA